MSNEITPLPRQEKDRLRYARSTYPQYYPSNLQQTETLAQRTVTNTQTDSVQTPGANLTRS